jgi:hypothetical protein
MDKKPPGRPKGARNKISGSAKENITAVFTRLGSTAAMAEWAEANQTEFYKIYARLLPTEVEGTLNAALTCIFRDPTDRPAQMNGYHRKPEVRDGD